MSDANEIDVTADAEPSSEVQVAGDRHSNGNGAAAIGEPEFFLPPLLASNPLPYLFDGEGNLVDADGSLAPENGNGNGLPAAIRRLQAEALSTESSETESS